MSCWPPADRPAPSAESVSIAPMRDPGLLPEVARWHHEHCLELGLRSSLERRRAQLEPHLDSASIPLTLIALDSLQRHPLGCVSLVRYRASVGGNERVWLSNLYVRPDWRRRGLGRALVHSAGDEACRQGLEALWLFTDRWQAFYQSCGWQPGGGARVSGSEVDILRLALV